MFRASSKEYANYDKSKYIEEEYIKQKRESESVKHLNSLLLDSSLKSETLPKIEYNSKIIKCGKYYQIYERKDTISRQIKGYEKTKIKEKNINNLLYDIEEDNIFNLDTNISNSPSLKEIEEKNIQRSKNNMCRLILANQDIFKTFITLTFAEDMQDIKKANYEFQKFRRKIKRTFPEFLYVAVTEFQKNGKVHYHLITNIGYDNLKLINENISLNKLYQIINENANMRLYKSVKGTININLKMNDFPICLRYQNGKLENTKMTYNYKTHSLKIFKTIKYWNNGFTNVMSLDLLCGSENVARYMSKYMMKDLDNRLWGHNRYMYSQELQKPEIIYLDSNNNAERFILDSYLESGNIKYSNVYKDKFDNVISFTEIESNDIATIPFYIK